MNLEELKSKSNSFEIDPNYINTQELARKAFIEKFPIDKILDLTLEEFALGNGEDAFCYWLEFKKFENEILFFGIGGSTSAKFGLYKSKNNKYYIKNKENEVNIEEINNHFILIKNSINKAINLVEENKINEIKNIELPISTMVLQKILAIYFPEKFLTIGSTDILIKVGNDIKLENIILNSKNLIEINYKCREKLDSIDKFKNWHYLKLGKFIWDSYNYKNLNKEENNNNKSETKFWFYAPGKNASKWEEFYEEGIMALEFDKLDDLNVLGDYNNIIKLIKEKYNSKDKPFNDTSANIDLRDNINIGDIIIVKKGRNEFLGYGIVTSKYYFDKNRKNYFHCRKVIWKQKGLWKEENNKLPLKTLTNIKNNEHILKLIELMNIKLNNKNEFILWLTNKYGNKDGTKNSYIKSIKIISEILSKDIFSISDTKELENIYNEIRIQQTNKDSKYYNPELPSHGNSGFYSASINDYIKFLKEKINVSIIKNENKINFPLNQILYGPPGTGKTYNTINYALTIIDNLTLDELKEKSKNSDERKKLVERFNELIELGQIEFITFHQSYSYEDFIQGIKPDIEFESSGLSFKKIDGIFKKISKLSFNNLINSSFENKEIKKSFEEVFNELIKPLKEGEEYIELEMKKSSFKITEITEKSIHFIKQSGSSTHSLSIETLKKMYISTKNDLIIGGLQPYYNPLLEKLLEKSKELSKLKKSEELKDFVIIIDEINRANISRVFGELITLIEEDKRWGNENQMEIKLPSGDPFSVPKNLYIIGTMNTADKSIALLDIALRRRFKFIPMYPDYSLINDEKLQEILKKLNQKIKELKGIDFMIGHSFFINKKIDALPSIVNNELLPLLNEYFNNKIDKIKEIFNFSNIKIEENENTYQLEYKSYNGNN